MICWSLDALRLPCAKTPSLPSDQTTMYIYAHTLPCNQLRYLPSQPLCRVCMCMCAVVCNHVRPCACVPATETPHVPRVNAVWHTRLDAIALPPTRAVILATTAALYCLCVLLCCMRRSPRTCACSCSNPGGRGSLFVETTIVWVWIFYSELRVSDLDIQLESALISTMIPRWRPVISRRTKLNTCHYSAKSGRKYTWPPPDTLQRH